MNNQSKFHIGLHVTDVAATINFYRDLFGAEPVKVKADYAKFELDNPGLVISFIQSPAKVSPVFGHLGLRVASAEDLAQRKSVIEEKLEIVLEEQNTSCCYALQDKFWVNDPDGYEWEVYFVKEESEPQTKRHQLSACC